MALADLEDIASRPTSYSGGLLAAYGVFLAIYLVAAFHFIAAAAAVLVFVVYVCIPRRGYTPPLSPVLPFLALPAWALLSVSWSETPLQSLNFAAQFFLTAFMALFLARTIPARTILAAVTLAGLTALLVFLGLGLADLSSGRSLSGGMGKNVLGNRAALITVLALGALLDARQPGWVRGAGALTLIIGFVVVLLTDSVGSVVMMAAGIAFFVLLAILALTPRSVRGAAVVFILLVAPLAYFATPTPLIEEGVSSTIKALGRNPTLTRRTEIWRAAMPLIAQRPILGHGYRAFWARQSTDAAGVRRIGGASVSPDAGFSFHNTYVELCVGLGIVGVAILLATIVVGGVRLVASALGGNDEVQSAALAAAFFGLLILSASENLLTVQLHISTLIFFMACCIGVTSRSD